MKDKLVSLDIPQSVSMYFKDENYVFFDNIKPKKIPDSLTFDDIDEYNRIVFSLYVIKYDYYLLMKDAINYCLEKIREFTAINNINFSILDKDTRFYKDNDVSMTIDDVFDDKYSRVIKFNTRTFVFGCWMFDDGLHLRINRLNGSLNGNRKVQGWHLDNEIDGCEWFDTDNGLCPIEHNKITISKLDKFIENMILSFKNK